jgi:adenosylcobinamide-phosphate synthase
MMLYGWSVMLVLLLVIAGVLLDMLLGEARRWHPLVGFGRLANAVERRLNAGNRKTLRGIAGWLLAVVPLVAVMVALTSVASGLAWWLGAALHAILLYFCIGLRSLRDHVAPIEQALRKQDLAAARELTGRIVSRDTAASGESDLAKAAVESLLENGNDAVFGTLFWFIVAGGPGAVLFRLANTLDAMWGYRTQRFLAFGCTAARIDDALNWIPARLTALSYALLGNGRRAWHCWRSQAPAWSSPNAGPVMAAGAGALGLALGGAAVYAGEVEMRPMLGAGRPAAAADIGRAWRLVRHVTLLWIVVLACAAVIERMTRA